MNDFLFVSPLPWKRGYKGEEEEEEGYGVFLGFAHAP